MAKGRPAGLRLETAERRQSEFQQTCLDDLLSSDHRARQVWEYVEGLDLSLLYGRVQTTVSSSGRPAIDPAILVSLWLYATLEGVGSARLLDRLCQSDAAYLWLLGGVTVNYHTLADLRTEAGPLLDELLSSSMAGMIASGAVRIETLAVDGMRLQAAADRGTFRRSERLAKLEKAALEVVQRLRAEVDEDPAAAQRRTTARRLAVAEDRARRLDKARQAQAEIERQREEQRQKQRRKEKRKDHKEARTSTVDPQARIMKMADGSFRPAYNVQFKTAAEGATSSAYRSPTVAPTMASWGRRWTRSSSVMAYGPSGCWPMVATPARTASRSCTRRTSRCSARCPKARAIRRRPSEATRRGPLPGGNEWPARKGWTSIEGALPRNGLTLTCATMASDRSWCAAGRRSRQSCSGTSMPSTSSSSNASTSPDR